MNNITQEVDYGNYYDAWSVSFYQTDLGIAIIVTGIIVLLSLTVLLGIIIFKKIRSKPENVVKRRLKIIVEDLKNNNFKVDTLYLQLTTAIKSYIKAKFNIEYIELTDLELLNYLENIKISKDIKNIVETLIINAQESKYALKEICKDKLELDINNSFLFVHRISEFYNLKEHN